MTDEKKIVEAVARALCAADGLGPDEDWRYQKDSGVMLDVAVNNPAQWTRYIKNARAAIEAYEQAIAEAGFVVVPETPTQEMLDAVCSDDPNAIIRAHDGPVRETYREMIARAPSTTDRSAPGPPSE